MDAIVSNLGYIRRAAGLRSAGVVGDPHLAAGYLIGSSLLGLLVIIGAFWYHRSNLSLFRRSCIMSCSFQENRLMGVQLIFNSLMILLTMDAVNLIMAIIFGAQIAGTFCHDRRSCVYIEIVWFLSRWFGVMIHLLSASLSISHLCHQKLSVTKIHIVYSLIGVLIGIIIPLYLFITDMAVFVLAAFMFLFALLVIVALRAPTLSPSTATLKILIMIVAMCNFLVVYVPTFIVQCLLFSHLPVSSYDYEYIHMLNYDSYPNKFENYRIAYVNVLFFTNLHLIFDGLLCGLVLKLPSGEEQQPQQQELQQW